MNLVFTTTSYPPATGGAQLHTHQLAQQLGVRHRLQVATMWTDNRSDWLLGTTLRSASQSRDLRVDGINVHQLGFSPHEKMQMLPYVLGYYAAMAAAAPGLAGIIEPALRHVTRGADVIHNVRIGREPLTLASQQRARALGVPFVFTPLHHPRWTGWPYLVYEQIYRSADALIALTTSEKEALIRMGVREERIGVTGIGPILAPTADGDGFLRRHHLSGPVVLFLGQHYAYKGYAELLRAAPLVWSKVPEACFVFMGPPVGASERAFAPPLDPRIRRLGSVSLQEKTDALAACSALCVPSTQESFGGVYTEAWSFAKPVVACPIPAVCEVVQDGVDGYLVRPDPPALAERLVDLLLSPAQAASMGAAGQRKVQERYAWPRLAERTEAVYAACRRG